LEEISHASNINNQMQFESVPYYGKLIDIIRSTIMVDSLLFC